MSYGGTLYGGGRRRRRAHTAGSFPWQEFLRQNGEFRAFMDQMSALYRQQVGEGQPLGTWQQFLKAHGFKELMDRLAAQYRQMTGRGLTTGGMLWTGAAIAPRRGGRVRRARGLYGGADIKREIAGERMFLEGHNPWLNFLHAHKGQGYDMEQLPQMYHQQYAQAGPKVYGGY